MESSYSLVRRAALIASAFGSPWRIMEQHQPGGSLILRIFVYTMLNAHAWIRVCSLATSDLCHVRFSDFIARPCVNKLDYDCEVRVRIMMDKLVCMAVNLCEIAVGAGSGYLLRLGFSCVYYLFIWSTRSEPGENICITIWTVICSNATSPILFLWPSRAPPSSFTDEMELCKD